VNYLLVHTGPVAPASAGTLPKAAAVGLLVPGWTLLVSHGSRWSWSASLEDWGAPAGAPAAMAQDAAGRVLAEQQLTVTAWEGDAGYCFRATVEHPAVADESRPAAAPDEPGRCGWDRRRRWR
jgi:hypothetical protein